MLTDDRNCLVEKNRRIKAADFGLSCCLQADKKCLAHTKEFPVHW